MPRDLIADLIDLRGAGLNVTEFDSGLSGSALGAGVVRLGVHRGGPLPTGELDGFDILLSAQPDAPRPWVGLAPDRLDPTIAELKAAVSRHPAAAAALAQVLRLTLRIPFEEALVLESLAYSMLLASDGFQTWRAARAVRVRPDDFDPRVVIADVGGALQIRLNRPAARNAFDARMRDELCAALAFAGEHPDAPPVVVSGEGPAFSAGGDLDEFGQAGDPGQAHLIRTLRSPARLIQALGPRATARLHGACVGAGIEVPAGAMRVTARPGAVFRLPEVSMGLIPGAGGTATISRRIGRRRTAFMAISGADIDLATALAWGLVDAIEP